MAELVLDASALLALLNDESGAEIVASALPGAPMSAANLADRTWLNVRLGVQVKIIR